MHRFNDGWAYKLDYDKEIAEDLKQIAACERQLPLAAVLTKEEREGAWYYLTIEAFLFTNVDQRAPLLGLSPADVADLWWDSDLDPSRFSYHAPEPAKGWFARHAAINKRLLAEFGEYVDQEPQKRLTKLRATLSRHRRNKVKFG